MTAIVQVGAIVLATVVSKLPNPAPATASRLRHAVHVHAAPIQVSCPEALSDGTLVDARLGDVLASLASGIKWEGSGAPTRCRREVRLHCGPDLDHDGDPEAIVEIASLEVGDSQNCDRATDSTEQPPATLRHFFLASRHQSTWRAAASVQLAVIDDDNGGDRTRLPVYFVRQSGGSYGVRVDSYAARGACQVGGYEVFSPRGGSLVTIARGDLSAPCVPCSCH